MWCDPVLLWLPAQHPTWLYVTFIKKKKHVNIFCYNMHFQCSKFHASNLNYIWTLIKTHCSWQLLLSFYYCKLTFTYILVVARQLFKNFPEARLVDKKTPYNERRKMGHFSWTSSASSEKIIVNLYVVHKVCNNYSWNHQIIASQCDCLMYASPLAHTAAWETTFIGFLQIHLHSVLLLYSFLLTS